jgi:ribosomal protein S18 acetylase RimI-like enzyme
VVSPSFWDHQAISEISIRDATEADLERVAEIKVRNWADTYASLLEPTILRPHLDPKRQLAYLHESLTRPDAVFLVAHEPSGAVTAFALTYLAQEPEPWLESLHVASESRGSGVGTLLMRETAARVRARGYNSMRLGVVRGNAAASRFYERLGADMIGLEPATWAPGVWHELYRWPDLVALADRNA